MKRYRKRRVIHINPRDFLIGHSGEIKRSGRLLPLRMTRKYRNALQQEESNRHEQILQISQLVTKLENLASVINNLKKENKNNINTSLLLELEYQKSSIKKHLLYLKSKVDVLPKTLNKSMKDIFNGNSKFEHLNKTFSSMKRKKNEKPFSEPYVNKKYVLSEKNCEEKQSMSDTLPKTAASKTCDLTSRTSWFGSVKSQILVRDKNLQLRTISIDLFSNGENFRKVISTELGEEVKSYNVIFGTKQVDGEKSLWEQGIYHGSTVDLNVRLHGGMGKKKKREKNKGSKSTDRSTDVVHLDEKSPVLPEATEEKASVDEDTHDISAESVKVVEPTVNDRSRTSWFGSVKSQILVRDNNYLQLRTISIDLFSNGENLRKVISTELGEEVKSYNVIFGTKQVDGGKSLWEQGIYHGSTVDLNVRLHGGMGKKGKKREKNKGSKSTDRSKAVTTIDNPELWTKLEVGQWIDTTCKDLEIDETEVSMLKSINGKGLNSLQKEDWMRRSPDQGDLMYNLWIALKETFSNKETDTTKENKPDVVHVDEKSPVLAEATEEKASVDEDTHDISAESVKVVEPTVNDRSSTTPPTGLFGKVDNLKDLEDSISLYDFASDAGKSTKPKLGSVISVSGVCLQEPRYHGFVGTILIKDDPPGAVSVFSQLKVDILGNNENKGLDHPTVELLFKEIRPGVPVAVRGRVERLEDEDVSSDPDHEMLKFKLVVDSDYHALVYVKNNTALFARQLSQPWYVQQGIYSFIVDDRRLHEGDIIQKTPSRVFCKSTVPDEIKKIAVAFKNSFDGDVFVGVEESGKITGMDLTEEKLLKWREQISMTIGQILPGSNEQVSICSSDQEAKDNIGKKCFVSVMKLDKCTQKRVEKVRVVARIHVPKGTARVYFSKQSDIHAYVRVGAENKRFTDYMDLFSRLESLCSRKITPIADEESYIEQQCNDAIEHMQSLQKYKVLKSIKYESQEREFKMIFGDKPVDIIEKRYLSPYTCGFLNSLGGSIFFGVQEDEKSKLGHVVGIVVPLEERKELVRNSIITLSKFYPPVNTGQFHITFYDVSVSLELILQYHAKSGKCVILHGPPDEIGTKWPKYMRDKLPGKLCRVIRVKPQCFCVVAEKLDRISEQLIGIVEQFEKENSKVQLVTMDDSELKPILENVCIIELQVNRSPYPIHMTKPIETFVFDKHGKLNELHQNNLLYRFALDSRSKFDVDKFLKHVEHFDLAGNSYVLITSPFDLPKNERDLYGLVIPKWTLTIDFDKQIKRTGHLYQIFEDLNDLHQTERNRFVVTPQDHKLDLNSDHGICWLAARGYEEIANSLSEEGHGKWNSTHRGLLRSLLETELTRCVKPNRLNIVVLWDDGHRALVDSLYSILDDMLSIIHGDRTAVTFVCSTSEAQSDISDKVVKPLQDNYWENMEKERVYVVPPYVLAQFLSNKLPAPYRPEDDYQVPHKKYYRQVPHTLPETLPKRLRQHIHGHLKMMYMTKERKPNTADLDKERKQFYSGSEINNLGLRGMIGIKRSQMAALEEEFKFLSNDKKSHVSLIFIKADRGAGTTTMCLQFLFRYHKEYPCAQLIEIKDGLVSYIEDINKETKLPLLLLVDEEIANLQEFLEFKKELVERRNVNVILLLIEPAEVFCIKESTSSRKPNKIRIKSARDSALTSPYKVVELRRELDEKEMEELTNELIAVDKGKLAKLEKLNEKAKHQKTLRTFAHFSLTAFGNKFLGLNAYVKFRLGLANEKQKDVLAFLSLTHVFTDYLFPTSALSGFLETKKAISLEVEFENSYLRELLSPPIDQNDSRRISFLEVAQEILEQLAAASPCAHNHDKKWSFIRNVSVKMAKHVLSVNISTKTIDRLTRKLFVTSEYESEKFSLLIRSMKEVNADIARDTLIELVDVFQKHSSFRAHLLAHLAKYHMIVYNNFKEAKPLIEEAVKDQKDDVLLHHIHGDIIRRYVQFLKSKEHVDMNTIVAHAIKSSECFGIVRHKRPRVSHGYVSDAMVRITVMQAAIKDMGGKPGISFVDYLIRMIDEIREREDEISTNERYLLSLIPDAHQYLDEGVIDFEHKEKWKENFLKCIGNLTNLKTLCEKLRNEKDYIRGCGNWLFQISIETQVLYNALEIETKDLTPQELERRIKEIEECGSSSKLGERAMKFWIRYSRQRMLVPPLEEVNKRVKEWSIKTKKRGEMSPYAEFYNYVVNVLIALKDPKDREKMSKAEKLIKRQQGKRYKKEDVVLPLEWLHPKGGHHIDSIESLLNHDDLVKNTSRSSGAGKKRPGREVIEGFLFQKQITKWEGTVKQIKSDWQGTIVFKNYLDVRFVPQSVQPSKPTTGDTVRFCLSFDRYGLSAWSVVHAVDHSQPKHLPEIVSSDEDSSSENSEGKEDTDSELTAITSLFALQVPEERNKNWGDYNGQLMQGVVVSANPDSGYGFLRHPDVLGKLFFHASQLVNPVKSLAGKISKYMALEFKVEILTEKTRAAAIRVLKSEEVSSTVQEFLVKLREEQHSSPSCSRREKEPNIMPSKTHGTPSREEGVIVKLHQNDNFGYIKPDNSSYGKDIFFHRNDLVNKRTILTTGDRVQFCVHENKKRLEATDIIVQSQHTSDKWDQFVNRGIQEGFILSTTDKGGIINSQKVTGRQRNLHFNYKDIANTGFPIVEGSKVHFKVQRRGGKWIAVEINVIGAPEGMPIHQGLSFPTNNREEFYSNNSDIPFPTPYFTGPSIDPFENQLEDMNQLDESP